MKSSKDFKETNAINWYPGHMLKAKKELSACLKRVDVVVEIRDARIPHASVNQDFEPLLQQKNRIIVLNKTELADPAITKEWADHFKSNGQAFRFIDVKKNQGIPQIIPKAREMMQEKWGRLKKKGIRPPALKLVIVGIPNVGKSSLINKLVKRKAAVIGPTPGVTKQQSWARLGKDVEILDTPGILWPKFESNEMGFVLAITGAIKDTVVGEERMCRFLLQFYLENFGTRIQDHYGLATDPISSDSLIEEIGKKRGCMKGGNEIDLLRTAKLVLHDFRGGRLGRVSFESPTSAPEEN